MWLWEIGLLLQAAQEKPESFLGITIGQWISLITILVAIAGSYAKLSEEVKELKLGRQENKDAIKELRRELANHCDDDDAHINKKFYDALMQRLNQIEFKVDQRNNQAGRSGR